MMNDQMLERIIKSAKQQSANVVQAAEHAKEMSDYNSAVLVEAVLAVGSGIIDTLNNIAILLYEMLPKEE